MKILKKKRINSKTLLTVPCSAKRFHGSPRWNECVPYQVGSFEASCLCKVNGLQVANKSSSVWRVSTWLSSGEMYLPHDSVVLSPVLGDSLSGWTCSVPWFCVCILPFTGALFILLLLPFLPHRWQLTLQLLKVKNSLTICFSFLLLTSIATIFPLLVIPVWTLFHQAH